MAVLGAGTMGSRIAAHISPTRAFRRCCSISSFRAKKNRNAAALKGIENAAKQKPGAFFTTPRRA
jgi:3-hydroxyacyl-CoA dehydrogenase